MRVGVSFPVPDIGTDPVVIRDYAQAAEDLGYDHLTFIDHVIHAGTGKGGWQDFYTRKNMFHEPFVLLGHLAAVTKRIELATAVMILPQRQTVLVAKQAAEVDVLSGGRLRLGVGIGWNDIEYVALNENFRNRARRLEEQIALMRRLWTEELVTFEGEWHRVEDAGLNPLPVQRPIPIWIGAGTDPAIRRAGRIADGLIASPRFAAPGGPGSPADQAVTALREAAAEAGRDPMSVGIDASLHLRDRGMQELAAEADEWRTFGASHLTFRTLDSGKMTVDEHMSAMRRFMETWR